MKMTTTAPTIKPKKLKNKKYINGVVLEDIWKQ